jgi:uncharacterized OB-fold protein
MWEDGLRHGKLLYQHCTRCEDAVFFPRVLCPSCGSAQLNWLESSGNGILYAVTVVRSARSEPYNVVLVDLAEGFRMMGTVADVHDGELAVGAHVCARVARHGDDEVPLVVFDLT